MRVIHPRYLSLLASRNELRFLGGALSAGVAYGASVAFSEPAVPWKSHVQKLAEGVGDGTLEAAAALATLTADPQMTRGADADELRIAADRQRAAIGGAGAIPPLIALCEAGTAEGKTVAAAALRNLAKSADNRAAIVNDGLAPLVALTKTKELPEGMEQATHASVQALSYLADCDANKAAIAKAGAIAPLITIVKQGKQPWIRARAAGVLQKLATTSDNKVAIAREGGIPALIVLALEGTPDGKSRAAGCLWRLARNGENQRAITHWGGVPALIALVREGTPQCKDRAVAALENLANNKEARAKMLRFNYVVD